MKSISQTTLYQSAPGLQSNFPLHYFGGIVVWVQTSSMEEVLITHSL